MQVISAGQLLEWLADLLLDLREGDQASRPDFQVYWLAVVLPERGHESEHYLDSKLEEQRAFIPISFSTTSMTQSLFFRNFKQALMSTSALLG